MNKSEFLDILVICSQFVLSVEINVGLDLLQPSYHTVVHNESGTDSGISLVSCDEYCRCGVKNMTRKRENTQPTQDLVITLNFWLKIV